MAAHAREASAHAHRPPLRHPRQPAGLRGRARRPSRPPGPRSCGASATSSATAPSPTPASRWPSAHCAICLAGNHDLVVLGDAARSTTSRAAPRSPRAGPARTIVRRDARVPAPGSSRRRRGARSASTTPARATRSGSTCSPAARRAVPGRAAAPRLRSIGHSHVALSFTAPEGEPATGETRRRRAPSSTSSSGEWLLNPGSVGQPRDGDPRAAWLLLDTDGLDRRVAPRGVRHRRRGRGHPRRAAAGLARRAPRVRPVACRAPCARSPSLLAAGSLGARRVAARGVRRDATT